MPRSLPPLNALRAFEAAGRRQSFTGAAEELNVTHAAISRHVRGLERRLQIQLFRTVARGVELTEDGAAYLTRITPALDQIAEATEALSLVTPGTLSISCEPTFAFKWLMPRLGQFQAMHPEIEIDLHSTPELANLKTYESDLALRFCHDAPDVRADLISISPVYPYGAPSLPVAKDPSDLLNLKLMHEDNGALWKRWFAAAGLHDAYQPQKTSGLTTLLAIEGALAGQGVVLSSAELVCQDVEAGRLKKLSPLGLAYGGYHLLCLEELAGRRSIRQFRDWLLTETDYLRDPPHSAARKSGG
ncbi:MAG: LysR substrate-binding domain-containing protein [Pseudomonadota bacterium]